MKKVQRYTFIAALLIGLAIAALAPQQAAALGTTSGTTINNAASVLYSVGSVTQPLVTGPSTTFVVDTRVLFNVSKVDANPVAVVPGDNTSGTTRRLQFQLQNDSNANITFRVSAADLASTATVTFGGTGYADNQNTATTITACFDVNANNVCDGGENDVTVNEAALNTTIIVTGDIPAGATNGQILGALLTATAVDGSGNPLAETNLGINQVDIVLGDGAGTDDAGRSATYTDRSAWSVTAALLTVTKTAAVYSDPFNGTASPKAVPGAVITYTINVANGAGGAAAQNVTISDSLNAEIAAGRLAFATQFTGNVPACGAGEGIVVNGVCKTNAGDGDNTDFSSTVGNTVTASGLSIAANASATVQFQVVIQ